MKPELVSTGLHKLGLRALRLANFPRTPTMDSFRAYIILQCTWMKEEEPLTCVAFVGLALRYISAHAFFDSETPANYVLLLSGQGRNHAWAPPRS